MNNSQILRAPKKVLWYYHNIRVKQQRCTRAASCGASEAPPHENGTMLADAFPRQNTLASYPSRSKLQDIHFKRKPLAHPPLGQGQGDWHWPGNRHTLYNTVISA
jgi:hypothetical protein